MTVNRPAFCPRRFASQSQEAEAISSIELMVAMAIAAIATFARIKL